MRLALFFLISIVFHAAIFALPFSFYDEAGEGRLIPVVFLSGGGGGEQALNGKSTADTGRGETAPVMRRQGPIKVRRPESASLSMPGKIAGKPEKETKSGDQARPFTQDVPGEGFIVAASRVTAGVEEDRDISVEETAEGDRREESGGRDHSEIVIDPGGQGKGNGSSELVFARVSYAHTPKPEYPERARRAGWEGTVLLRVLVDQQGKSKWIEVSRSSGFEILDGAAMDTVRRWRFLPARYGERRVESWVKVPIIFCLADLEN